MSTRGCGRELDTAEPLRPAREQDLVPYESLSVPQGSRVLVLAPHPDDEVFGCGGCARLHALQGARVDIVVLTDGAGAGSPQTRASESRAACAALGLGAPEFWGYADRGLAADSSVLDGLSQRIAQSLATGGHDWVYAPSPWEVHPDHRATARAVAQAVLLRRAGGSAVGWAAYEVGSPLWPSRLVNIDTVAEDKQRAMACFTSQLALQPYDQHIAALNRYRSYTVSGQCRMAEALWLPDDGQMLQVIRDWDAGHHPGAGMGGPQPG